MALTRDDVKEAVKEAIHEHHICVVFPSEEDRVLARDMIATGRTIKKTIIVGIAAFILGGVGLSGYVVNKVHDVQTEIARVRR